MNILIKTSIPITKDIFDREIIHSSDVKRQKMTKRPAKSNFDQFRSRKFISTTVGFIIIIILYQQ